MNGRARINFGWGWATLVMKQTLTSSMHLLPSRWGMAPKPPFGLLLGYLGASPKKLLPSSMRLPRERSGQSRRPFTIMLGFSRSTPTPSSPWAIYHNLSPFRGFYMISTSTCIPRMTLHGNTLLVENIQPHPLTRPNSLGWSHHPSNP